MIKRRIELLKHFWFVLTQFRIFGFFSLYHLEGNYGLFKQSYYFTTQNPLLRTRIWVLKLTECSIQTCKSTDRLSVNGNLPKYTIKYKVEIISNSTNAT